jgi:diguanylate cyclase (GGDEF)-like protein
LVTEVSVPSDPPARPPEIPERRIRQAWWIFVASYLILGLIAVARLATGTGGLTDWLVVALVTIVGVAAFRHREAAAALEVGRREEAESIARILSSLSRSVSPDAILGAIVGELADGTGADHIVIVRRRPEARILDATLVSARAGVPDSTTRLPIGDLEDPINPSRKPGVHEAVRIPVVAEPPDPVEAGRPRGRFEYLATRMVEAKPLTPPVPSPIVAGHVPREGQQVADRIAARTRKVYGLMNTLAAPLTTDGIVIGAIVLSHRTARDLPEGTRRLLSGAASEASSALSRAYSLRAAEADATTDALTGLPNRRYFDEFCGLLARRRRSDDAVGVLMIDIDRFKVLNDTFGHSTGDEVLRAVGGAIVSAVREDDVPARYGGEEFVVLLRNPSPAVAFEVGERVRSSVAGLDLSRFGVAQVTVSVGVAVDRQTDQPIGDLTARADAALYRAKRAGRDRVIAS